MSLDSNPSFPVNTLFELLLNNDEVDEDYLRERIDESFAPMLSQIIDMFVRFDIVVVNPFNGKLKMVDAIRSLTDDTEIEPGFQF